MAISIVFNLDYLLKVVSEFKQKHYLCRDNFHHASFECVPGWNFCFLYVYVFRFSTKKAKKFTDAGAIAT